MKTKQCNREQCESFDTVIKIIKRNFKGGAYVIYGIDVCREHINYHPHKSKPIKGV